MAAINKLAATAGRGTGKGAARSTRRDGRIPGVIYGGGEAALPIALDHRETTKLIYAGHFLTTILEIDIDGVTQRVLPRDYQLDVVKDIPLHVDFLRLKAGSTLRVNVPVHFTGQEVSPGMKRGGSLNIVRHTIELRVPADAIPEAVTADISQLDINDSLHISAIKLPEGCRPVIARDFTVASIAPPTTYAEEAPAAAAAAAATATPAAGAPAAAAKAPAKGAAAPAKGAAPAKAPAKK